MPRSASTSRTSRRPSLTKASGKKLRLPTITPSVIDRFLGIVAKGNNLCFAVPPRQFGEEILQNKPLIYGVIKPDGAVSARVHIIHFCVEFRCRSPIEPSAFRV